MVGRILRGLRRRILGTGDGADYRAYLFEDLRAYLAGRRVERGLEIGPKDGLDTRRLLTLDPAHLTVINLPRLEESNGIWLQQIVSPKIEYISANVMYSKEVLALDPFNLIWCTGVLHHNPEQLRMARRLYDLLVPGGVLVLESAIARSRRLRRANCVEIVYPPSEETKRKHHLSLNITHLPSARAIASWLGMVGFECTTRSTCHKRVSKRLAATRVAYLATKPREPKPGAYYSFDGDQGYEIGKAL